MAIQQLLQPRQDGLPPGTQLGIVANEMAQSGQYKPFTSDGRPTVVKNLIDQESQKDAAKQAALAGQIQAQKEAEIMNAMRQMAAQQTERPVMAAQGGIITLPADVQMAEGGIVGFASKGYVDPEFPIPYETSEEDVYVERRAAEAKRKQNEAERLRQLEFLEAVGAPQAAQYRQTEPTASTSTRLGKSGIPEQDIGEVMRSMAAPRPAPSSRPSAAPSAAPIAAPTSPLQQYQTAAQAAIQEALAPLKAAQKKRELTPEELAFVKRQEENLRRSRERLTEQERRFLDLERQREEAGKTTGLQDLAAFLSRAGGARSLFAGLGQAARTQADIDAARRKEAQAAIDRKRQYFDLLEDRKDAIEQRDLAIQQGRMDRARAEQDRIDAVNRAIAQTTGTLEAQRMQGLASIMGHQITAEEAAKSRGQASRQADEAKMLALLGRLDQAKLEDLRKIEADHVKDPKYRMIYTMAATGAKLTPDQEAQLRAADAALEAKKAEVFKSINPRISQLESRVFGNGAKNIDLSKWGEPQVKSGR